MNFSFRIQASRPRKKKLSMIESTTLEEAIEEIYELYSEDAVMIWNFTPILLSYKYDLSVILIDILDILYFLRTEKEGNVKNSWPSNTFRTDWELSWKDEKLLINTKWFLVNSGTENLLNTRSHLSIEKKIFCNEWKKVLETILLDINEIDADTKLEGKTKLIGELSYLDNYGELYSHE